MSNKQNIFSAVLGVFFVGFVGIFSFFPTLSFAQTSKDYVPGEVLVKYKNTIDLKTSAGRRLESNIIRSVKGLKKIESLEENNLSLFKITNASSSVWDKIKELSKKSNVEYAEPNYYRKSFSVIPNDTYFSLIWGLNNTGQAVNNTTGTADADIDAPEAWSIATSTNKIITILDTGVLYNHPDLADNMWTSSTCYDASGTVIDDGCPNHGWDFVGSSSTNPNPDNDPIDLYGHGTHCAGIVGAVGNNSTGTVGVDWRSRLMAVKIFADDGGWSNVEAEIKGINFAKNNGASIISASFGGEGYSTSEKEAIDSFPGLFVTAAGNYGNGNGSGGWNNDDSNNAHHIYPSDYNSSNIISVAATNQNDDLASFSNYGTTSVDVGAPGVNILSTYLDNGYIYDSGTSMAVPYVSGLAGLVWSKRPYLSPSQVKNIILGAGDKKLSLKNKVVTGRRINAYRALSAPVKESVIINEVMWGGSSASSSDEWIELRNLTSRDIDLNGWSIDNASDNVPVTIGLDKCSTTTIPADGYYLISNFSASDTNSRLNIVPQCVVPGIDLNDDYSKNGQLILRDNFGIDIDSTPSTSTSAYWPAGTSTSPQASMSRNSLDPFPGDSTTSWYTSTKQRGWDLGATDLGTPGSPNMVPVVLSSKVSATSIKLVFDTTLLDDQTVLNLSNYRLQSPTGTAITLDSESNWISTVKNYPSQDKETVFVFGINLNEGDSYYLSVSGVKAQDSGLMSFYSATGTVATSSDPLIIDVSQDVATPDSTITFSGVNFGANVATSSRIEFIPYHWDSSNMTLPSSDIKKWSATSVSITIPKQAYDDTNNLSPLIPGRYLINIRNDSWQESQRLLFIVATDTANYITGRVEYSDSGVVGARIFAYVPGQLFSVPGARSTVNGWYALGPIMNGGNYKIRAWVSGFVSDNIGVAVSTSTFSIYKGKDVSLKPLPGVIKGKVIGSGLGYVTTSVEIQAFDANYKGTPPYRTSLNDDGTYQLKVPVGTFYVMPYFNSFEQSPKSRTVIISNATTSSTGNDFKMDRLTTYIQGKISKSADAENIDLTKVRVIASVPGLTGIPYRTRPDSSGNYTLYVPPNSYNLRLIIPGYGAVPSERTIDITSNNSVTGINFTIVSYVAMLSGSVRDVLGQNVSGVDISLQKNGGGYGSAKTMTDFNGNYYLGLTATGTYTAFVNPPFGSSYLQPIPTGVYVSAGNNNQDFVLPVPTKIIQARVMLDDTTQTDAVISAFKEGEPRFIKTSKQTRGVYRLRVGSGNWKVIARTKDSSAGWVYMGEPYFVSFGNDAVSETSSLITFRVVGSDATVTGRVLDPDGSPIVSGGVDIRNQLGVGAYSPLDNEGRFRIKIPAGTYNINIFCRDNILVIPATDSEPFVVAPGSTKNFGDIMMVPRKATISGIVTSKGVPLSGIKIHAKEIDKKGLADAVTNASGTYTLYVSNGLWEVMPSHLGSEGYIFTDLPQRILINASTSVVSGVNFNLSSANATINGRIVSDGNVITSLFGFASARNNSINTGALINNGVFSIQVPAGTYQISASFPQNADYIIDSQKSITVSAGETVNVDIPVSMTKSYVWGTIKSSDGNNLPTSTFVDVFAVNDMGVWRDAITTVSNGVHLYNLNLTPGRWRIGYRVDNPNYVNQPPGDSSFVVTTTGNIIKNITVPIASATISGTTYKPDASTSLAYAYVFAIDMSGKSKFHTGTKSRNDGTYTLKVKPGTYMVGAGLPPDASSYINPEMRVITVSAGESATGTDLVFKNSNSSIFGTISLNGLRHRAFVWAWSDKGGYSESFSVDGNYKLNVNNDDVWHIGASFDGVDTYYESPELAVTLGSDDKSIRQDLNLLPKGKKPTSQTVTFDATKMEVISLSDGTVIKIPAGALADSGNVTVSIIPTSQIARQSQSRPISLAYKITAINAAGQILTGPFNPKVIISLPYTDAQLSALGINENNLKVNYWSTLNNIWQEVDSAAVDTDNKVVNFSVDHFTYYGIIGTGDTTPPTFNGVSSSTVAGTSEIDLSWSEATDDVDPNSAIFYRIYRSNKPGNEDYDNPTYTTDAGVTSYRAIGLSCGTTYYFVVRAVDTSGNEDLNTNEISATTNGCIGSIGGGGGGSIDLTAPVINNIEVTTTATTSIISWKTNKKSVSWINYGTSTSYGLEIKNSVYSILHSLTLTGLLPETTYHFQVKSKDLSGNIGSFTDKTFITLPINKKKTKKVVPSSQEEKKIKRELFNKMTPEELKAKIIEIQTQIEQLKIQLIKLIQQRIANIEKQIVILKAQIKTEKERENR